MATYIVNRNEQATGEHEVHRLDTCNRLPEPANRVPLGEHYSCTSALEAARKIYRNSDGCWYCSAECHKK